MIVFAEILISQNPAVARHHNPGVISYQFYAIPFRKVRL